MLSAYGPKRRCLARSRRSYLAATLAAGWMMASACGVSDESGLPPDTPDPATVQNATGAMAFYRHVLTRLPAALDWLIADTGMLSDELAALPLPLPQTFDYTGRDGRTDLSAIAQSHSDSLHRLRAQAREARGFLGAYLDTLPALRGHLYAIEGYAEIYLADLFCSGIPLSTVEFGGDYTLAAGSRTAEVYGHAVELFDSASALLADSVDLQYFAAVGRGRALLAMGQYAAAASAVAAVPDGYRYDAVYTDPPDPTGSNTAQRSEAWSWFAQHFSELRDNERGGYPSVADREGVNGLDYRSSDDPRTAVVSLGPDPRGYDMYLPAKYMQDGAVVTPLVFTVASGVEARLIEAEAALAAGDVDAWLGKLNGLRQSPGAWGAIVPAITGPLADTTDPGTPDGRIDLMFRERAFWLFLTAHRHADLRRLVRQYARAPEATFPKGVYPGGAGQYGAEIVVPVPDSERKLNSKYAGCFHHDA